MPKSKKPRKKHQEGRWVENQVRISQATNNRLKALNTDVELAVEYRLPRGNFTAMDVQNLSTFIALATFLLYVGYGVDLEFVISTYGGKWTRMQEAFESYQARAKRTGRFIATAKELNDIRDGVEVAGTVIQKALDADPVRVLDVFCVTMKRDQMPAAAGEKAKWLEIELKRSIEQRKRLEALGEKRRKRGL